MCLMAAMRVQLIFQEFNDFRKGERSMSKKTVRTLVKNALAGFMAVTLCVSGILIMQRKVEAAETTTYADAYEDVLVYEDMTAKFNELWSAEDGKAQAPTMKGYVFGGWYQENGTDDEGKTIYKALDETAAANKKAENCTEGIIAKFVPAYVLSVKAQIDENASKGATRTDEELGSIRVISSVDSKDYQKVGFDILWNNNYPLKNGNDPIETTTIYTGLKVGEKTYEPQQIFGKYSKYLSVWRLNKFYSDMDDKIINVTPYWITKDGTKVEGLTKYVHVEDGYLDYISVPINLCSVEKVAAGTLKVTYPEGMVLVSDKVEFDGVFPGTEMAFHNDAENHTITFVGNALNAGTPVEANGIYANLRFQKGTLNYTSGTGQFLNFKVDAEVFCDWEENTFNQFDVWNIQY